MVSADHQDPIDVVDRQLWRDAQDVLHLHVAAGTGDRCDGCGRTWPCVARKVGRRAELAAFQPWNEVWTVRHDLRSLRAGAAWHGDGRSRRLFEHNGVFAG